MEIELDPRPIDYCEPYSNDELITKGEAVKVITDYCGGVDEAELVTGIESIKPTNAIPIEWLKKKYCNKGCVSTEKYMIRMGYLLEVIREWRSENESNRTDR